MDVRHDVIYYPSIILSIELSILKNSLGMKKFHKFEV